MRTTVNIEEHLLAEAKVRAARTHRSLGDIIDEALRQRFAVTDHPSERRSLPTFGAPGERVLVDLDDRDAVAEFLGDNTRSTESDNDADP
jgi:plasmid stability protein